jgi:hypothetical protein
MRLQICLLGRISSSKRDDACLICMNYDEAYQWLVSDVFTSRFEKKKMRERAPNEISIRNSEMLSDRYMVNYQKPKLLHIVLDVLIIQIQPTLMIKVRLSPLSTRRGEHIRNRQEVSQTFLGSCLCYFNLVDFVLSSTC